MIPTDDNNDNAPFRFVSGIFYGERSASNQLVVRERSVVSSYVGLARTQLGQAATWLWTANEISNMVEDNEPGACPVNAVPVEVHRDDDEFMAQIAILQDFSINATTKTFVECVRAARMMYRVTEKPDLGQLASRNNMNSFWIPGSPPTPTGFPFTLTLIQKIQFTNDLKLNPNATYVSIAGGGVIPGGQSTAVWDAEMLSIGLAAGLPDATAFSVASTDIPNPNTNSGREYRTRLKNWATRLLPWMLFRGGP